MVGLVICERSPSVYRIWKAMCLPILECSWTHRASPTTSTSTSSHGSSISHSSTPWPFSTTWTIPTFTESYCEWRMETKLKTHLGMVWNIHNCVTSYSNLSLCTSEYISFQSPYFTAPTLGKTTCPSIIILLQKLRVKSWKIYHKPAKIWKKISFLFY